MCFIVYTYICVWRQQVNLSHHSGAHATTSSCLIGMKQALYQLGDLTSSSLRQSHRVVLTPRAVQHCLVAISLPLPPKRWDYRHSPPCLVYLHIELKYIIKYSISDHNHCKMRSNSARLNGCLITVFQSVITHL